MVLHKMSPNGLFTVFSTRELGVMLLGSTKGGWLEQAEFAAIVPVYESAQRHVHYDQR